MSRLRASLAAAVIGLATSGLAVGSVASIATKPGYSAPSGAGPKKQPRKQAQVRQQAAEAKRLKRQGRNLAHQARGAYGPKRL
jgi:hypothetical protein